MSFFYCKQCLTTSLRPHANFNSEGICTPCEFAENLKQENHDYVLARLKKKINTVIRGQHRVYDCVVGVSGGKDSTRQAVWVREHLDMNPLLVCCSYPPKQMIDIGASNLANLISLGFDVEVYNPAPETAAQLSLKSFEKFGNVCKASEIALFTTVPKIALERGINIVFFGENPALQEGDSAAMGVDEFDANMLRGLNTLSAGGTAWINDVADDRKRSSYRYPEISEFERSGLSMLYLGPAWPDWRMDENAYYSVLNGLVPRTDEEAATGDITNASMLDEEFTNINMMIKYYKFGFGRATDICNELIRAKKKSREDAIEIVRAYDGLCSDDIIARYCSWVGISVEYFWSVVSRFVNKDIFALNGGRPKPLFEIGSPVCQ